MKEPFTESGWLIIISSTECSQHRCKPYNSNINMWLISTYPIARNSHMYSIPAQFSNRGPHEPPKGVPEEAGPGN